ncbi:MAG: heparinase II/III family protein, partial [Fidelibacterota bacterium]
HHKLTANHNTILVNGHGQAGAGREWLQYMEFEARAPAPAILRVESNPAYDYLLGDAGNIYIDEAGLRSYRRHLLFLKPDILLVLDDLEAEADSRFEWLLHGREAIVEAGAQDYEIVRNKARLWVHPIQPETFQADIQERELDASDVDGKIVTLNLKVESARRIRFLVALCALPDEDSPVPRITVRDGKLNIRHQGQKWTVAVLEPVEGADLADPMLTVLRPKVKNKAYSFERK